MRAKDRQTLVGRAEMALIGALAGLAMWVLIEKAQDVLTNPHVFVTVVSAVAGFFSVLLALCGPANLRRGAAIATVLALPAAALLGWASLRFDSLQAFVGAGHLILAWGVLLFVGTPFLAVALEDTGKLRSYSRLFDAAWGIVVRYSTAWLFVAVFWGVVFLSDALLQIVGLTLIEDLLNFDPVPFGLSGLMLGLGLAVVHEMRAYVSPFLVLRLLRLLVPVMLGVVVVFVVAFVLRDQAVWRSQPRGDVAGCRPGDDLFGQRGVGQARFGCGADRLDAGRNRDAGLAVAGHWGAGGLCDLAARGRSRMDAGAAFVRGGCGFCHAVRAVLRRRSCADHGWNASAGRMCGSREPSCWSVRSG